MEGAYDLVTYTYEELKSITGKFSTENFVGNSLFGKLFRGQIQDGEEVMVKIWVEDSPTIAGRPELQQSRFEKEIQLLTKSDMRSNPNLVKLIGYCYENGHLGVVYKQKPLNTLLNILFRDDFKWLARVRVAFSFAFLLKQFHDQGLWLRNIEAANLLVDQGFNAILFDFSTLVGGDFGGVPPSEQIWPHYGYFTPHTIDTHIIMTGQWTAKADVFAFGVLLLNLFAKKVYDPKVDKGPIFAWALMEYRNRKFGSLVDRSFETDDDPWFDAADGLKITKLALDCLEENIRLRPSLEDVIERLHELKVVRRYSHILGMPQVSARLRDAPPPPPPLVPPVHSLVKRKINKYLRFLVL